MLQHSIFLKIQKVIQISIIVQIHKSSICFSANISQIKRIGNCSIKVLDIYSHRSSCKCRGGKGSYDGSSFESKHHGAEPLVQSYYVFS
jgi:hypothetical protein